MLKFIHITDIHLVEQGRALYGHDPGYASYNVAEASGSDKRSIIAGYKYNLSKRTQAYFQLANGNAALNVSGAATAKSSNGYGFGLTHSF